MMMMPKTTVQLFAIGTFTVVVWLAAAPRSEAAFMEGKVMTARLIHRTVEQDSQIIFDSAPFVVGPGVELTGFGFNAAFNLPALVDIDVSDANFLLTAVADQPFAYQDTILLIDVNHTIPMFGHLVRNAATNWAGFVDFSAAEDDVTINVSQLSGLQGQRISLDHVVIPEPGALLLTAIAATGIARRRRCRPLN